LQTASSLNDRELDLHANSTKLQAASLNNDTFVCVINMAEAFVTHCLQDAVVTQQQRACHLTVIFHPSFYPFIIHRQPVFHQSQQPFQCDHGSLLRGDGFFKRKSRQPNHVVNYIDRASIGKKTHIAANYSVEIMLEIWMLQTYFCSFVFVSSSLLLEFLRLSTCGNQQK
jgi:hypothetical protein